MSYILTLDLSSGKVHRRYHTGSGYQGLEACNLDDAGQYQEITQAEFDAMPLDTHCGNCDVGEDDGSTQPVEMVP